MILGEKIGDGFASKWRSSPGSGVFMVTMTDMKNLSQTLGGITVTGEILRECDRVRKGDAEVGSKIVNPESGGPDASEQRISGGSANGLVAISGGKANTSFGEAIDVRGFDALIPIASE
jgi:hypothetical protein